MRRLALAGLALCIAVAAMLLLGWLRADGIEEEERAARDIRPLPLSEMDFSMTDQDGRPVGPDTLVGGPSLVFFGFTHCPEICPTTLYDISSWLDALDDDEAAALTPVFITVDPERDTVSVLSGYVGSFHEAIRAWTGTPDELALAAQGFRARYRKVPLGEEEYTMDHTAGVFLFDAAGRFVTTVDYHEPREFAVPKIRRILQ